MHFMEHKPLPRGVKRNFHRRLQCSLSRRETVLQGAESGPAAAQERCSVVVGGLLKVGEWATGSEKARLGSAHHYMMVSVRTQWAHVRLLRRMCSCLGMGDWMTLLVARLWIPQCSPPALAALRFYVQWTNAFRCTTLSCQKA